MNKLKGSLAAKIVAIVLLAACCFALLGSIGAVLFLDGYMAYGATDAELARERVLDHELRDYAIYLLYDFRDGMALGELKSDARFELLDAEKNVLAGTLGEGETVERQTLMDLNGAVRAFFVSEGELLRVEQNAYSFEPFADPEPTPRPVAAPAAETQSGEPEGTQIRYLRMSWTDRCPTERSDELRLLERLFPARYWLIAAAAVSFLLAVLLFAFLMAAAGHRDESGEVKAGFVEKIPTELLFLLGLCGLSPFLLGLNALSELDMGLASHAALASLLLLCAGLVLLLCLMSVAVRLKLKTFWKSSLTGRLVRFLTPLLKGLPLVSRWIAPFLLLLFLDLVYTAGVSDHEELLALGVVFKGLLAAAAILYFALAFRRLRNGARAIARGDENVVVDTAGLFGDLREQAEDLNHIRDGLERAVDERMKSERLRTELITNVSHDIKTPLTSIVNYVDLLAREEPENEKTKEYLAVLQRQSARLKKLTDDLVEASKASTGNLPVNAERLDLGVLLEQAAGEYGERLAEKGLELRVTKPEGAVCVLADPRHLWRMLDNLLSNILKYAQPGTRVYLDLTEEQGRAALSFRNVSAAPLNVKAEELTERFVRGDSARSTEGSGLGLAIAASLARLQGIDFTITVDGDLFKAVLRFQALRQELR